MKHRLRLWWEARIVSRWFVPEAINCTDCGLGRSRWPLVKCKDGGAHRWIGGHMRGYMEKQSFGDK